ncbi:unnamed protein product [Phyllotreta striolata]|uniref:Uncharacterized protein n=1 Tax=Phyllotreta striolata TaxID=444603 RepID=A0A9N9TKZ5_PHYSR|nr:unnamed protein product [Phyllotreta striolata]
MFLFCCRILKQPGKLVFYLFTIMFLIVRDSHELGPCFQNCFGPATRIKIYNDVSQGYLHVNGTSVVAKGDGIIYKISAGRYFYLYDMKAEKFICWKRPHRTKGLRHNHNRKHKTHASLVARKVSNMNCQFMDKIDKDTAGGYVNLVPAFNKSLKMKFNMHGKFVSQECVQQAGPVRHRNRCIQQANFLIEVYSDDGCKCPEARKHFCRSKFRKMKVFESICSRSNETYDS